MLFVLVALGVAFQFNEAEPLSCVRCYFHCCKAAVETSQ
jgi:hypothetical protein